MFILVTGGAASGKSEYAEKRLLELQESRDSCEPQGENALVYVATMHMDQHPETIARVKRHQALRLGKGFQTIEQEVGLGGIILEAKTSVLVECMTNLLANEMYLAKRTEVVLGILEDVRKLCEQVSNIVIVTGEIGCDGMEYDEFSMEYIRNLALINEGLAAMADEVVEVVYSIPVIIKGTVK